MSADSTGNLTGFFMVFLNLFGQIPDRDFKSGHVYSTSSQFIIPYHPVTDAA